MVKAQEYLDQNYPKEERRSIKRLDIVGNIGRKKLKLEGILDLSDFVNLERLDCSNNKLNSLILNGLLKLEEIKCGDNQLTTLELSNCPNLTYLYFHGNQLTSVDFLTKLPHVEKLRSLLINTNNIQPTPLDIFSKFINLKRLQIGTISEDPKKTNYFYGSLEPLKYLTKLEMLCIASTDIESGLEYLPVSLGERIARIEAILVREEYLIDCRPNRPDAKCSAIQEQLRPFNYDLKAWQLAHPEKMLIARPELFTNPDSKEKWIKALTDKITNSQQELQEVKQNETDKTKKIARLETKIQELEKVKQTISQSTQTELSTQDQGTQTDLTAEQIKQWEQGNQQTWYQKLIERFKK